MRIFFCSIIILSCALMLCACGKIASSFSNNSSPTTPFISVEESTKPKLETDDNPHVRFYGVVGLTERKGATYTFIVDGSVFDLKGFKTMSETQYQSASPGTSHAIRLQYLQDAFSIDKANISTVANEMLSYDVLRNGTNIGDTVAYELVNWNFEKGKTYTILYEGLSNRNRLSVVADD